MHCSSGTTTADTCHTGIATDDLVRNQHLGTSKPTNQEELEQAREALRLSEARHESLLRIIQHRFTSVQDLLDFALEEGIKLTGSRIGFIHRYDEKVRQFTRNSWSREVMDECRISERHSTHPLDTAGTWAEAVRLRHPVIINDSQSLMQGVPEGHAPLHRFLTIPVLSNGTIVAAIGVANKASDYDDTDVRQLTLLMDTTWKIVQQKRTEEKLRKSEQRLRVIFDASQAGILMLDQRGVITFANRRMAELFGCGMEELIGSSYADHLHPSEKGTGHGRLLQMISGESDNAFTERRYLRGSDEDFWGFLSMKRLEDRDGRLQSLVGTIADISDRKLAEEYRNKALDFVEALLAQSPMAIRIFDGKSGDCVLANRAASEIAEGSGHALLQQNFRKLASWRDAGLITLAESVLTDGLTQRVETELHTTFGKTKHVAYYLSRFMADEKAHLMVIGRDISERKRLEEENRHIEAQMLHVQKLESLGVLAGGIAHDFNNILTAVLGNADLALALLPPSSPARDNIQRINQAASKAAELARQMLAYSGKGHFITERLNLNALVNEMLQMLDVSISKKARLCFNFSDSLPDISADATQLRQVIMNLIINASEAIGEQCGQITFTTGVMECDRAYLSKIWITEQLAEGKYVFMEICDTGCGMDPETAAKIFEPFFSTKFTGRGLGMAVTLGIVRGHRGAITVESEKGRGTTFRILLPACEQTPVQAPPSSHRGEKWRGSGTVLLVDDEETIRAVGKAMLSLLGFRVITAVDGQDALELFRRNRTDIDCVLLDLTMPRMDGEQTFQELRRIEPGIRVVICSGYSEQDIAARFMSQGLAGFIQKPYKLSDLEWAMKDLVAPVPANGQDHAC
ncbi:hybrid sensor histidine kinase/response regulator [Pelobacter propionicus]|uniref:histidine kinase n=1 Tax=Pelobacter propionicus (strain DSM 2379 / NBRC 103807 / OttBd1) TaxID=338966 RepID=A1AT35_PELPD|nr:PAS domain S-box protein [Pelobacter propionicus]ABL00506.1 multi-sensor hybrid histidine kinase [Pelobacter propionicus DSM 2379]